MNSHAIIHLLEAATRTAWIGISALKHTHDRRVKPRAVFVSPQIGKPNMVRINVWDWENGVFAPFSHIDQMSLRFNTGAFGKPEVWNAPRTHEKMEALLQTEINRRLIKSTIKEVSFETLEKELQQLVPLCQEYEL